MQSIDANKQIVQSEKVDLGNIEELAAKIKTAQQKGAVQHVVGELPKKGGFIEVNGLSYKIEFADHVKGRFTIKMVLR
jgi:hypothetical protein